MNQKPKMIEEGIVLIGTIRKSTKEDYKPMIEYVCYECRVSELLYGVIPKKTCPKCGKYMDAIELEE